VRWRQRTAGRRAAAEERQLRSERRRTGPSLSLVVPPTFSPGPGTYATAQSVTIVSDTPGATVYYTTDGSTPNAGSPVFSAPVAVSSGTVTIRAYAAASGMPNSAVAGGAYTIGAGGGGGGATQTTTYTYDWMNNLTGVSMTRGSVTQTRSFVYDNAGRLTSATNPENGTVYYYYNSANTLQYKHDARGQDTVYTYDSQNRVLEIQRYPYGKNAWQGEDVCSRVTYSYDTNPYDSTGTYQNTTGRLAAAVYPVCHVLDSNGAVSVTEMYSYHPAGGVTIKHLHIYKPWYNSTENNFSDGWGDVEADYSYSSSGQVTSMTLPSTLVRSGCCAWAIAPVTYSYGYDGMGRPDSMTDNNPNSLNGYSTPWVQNVQYDFAGRLAGLQRFIGTGAYFGGSGFGVSGWTAPVNLYTVETRGYNVNSQLTSIGYSYNSAQFPTSWSTAAGYQYLYSATQNNGQIAASVNPSGQTVTYQYDALKRLVSAAAGGGTAWNETFQYDGFGNLTAKVLNGATAVIPVNAATNQLANASYDANGNMTSGAGATLAYDEANRIVSATETSGGTEYYAYAPDGKRMFRMEADGVTEEWMLWGARGEKLGTFAMVYNEYVGDDQHPYQPVVSPTLWFAGRKIWEGTGAPTADRLGTTVPVYPYGDEITPTANGVTKFATYFRDSFTGLDYADQRYYASTYGRFASPNPSTSSIDTKTPVSWGRYSYVLGDPVNSNDPRGLDDSNCPIGTRPAIPARTAVAFARIRIPWSPIQAAH